ncbi:MAG: hypothetical protein M1835_005532 [Candelina submexicana]|nr:MAG: hypothetical protein M1835_005532 [Candelina submexicana]
MHPQTLFFQILPILGITQGSFIKPPSSPEEFTLLDFDSLPTSHGLAPLPGPYNHLTFSTAFNVFFPESPSLADRISPHDLNCATSPPNALLGSRTAKDDIASFTINTTSTSTSPSHLRPYFTLHKSNIKPLDAPPPGTEMHVRGTSVDGKVLEWSVTFPAGYSLPLEVRMEEFSGEKWERLGKVEMWAEFGYDALDWEFCVDDLEVEFTSGDGLDEGDGVDGGSEVDWKKGLR